MGRFPHWIVFELALMVKIEEPCVAITPMIAVLYSVKSSKRISPPRSSTGELFDDLRLLHCCRSFESFSLLVLMW